MKLTEKGANALRKAMANYQAGEEFSAAIKKAKYTEQSGHCAICGEWFPFARMEADHIIPFSKGGRTILSNCQCLCKQCNRDKSFAMED